MITLYTFGPAFGLPDASPFVTKTETLLKMAGLPYRTDPNGFRRAPKGKLPYIEDDGTVVADSTFIRWHIEKKYEIDFDRHLSAEQRGIAWALEKLCEDNLYWAALHWRWLDDDNFARGPAVFFQGIPGLVRPLVQKIVRKKVASATKAHGIGRHTPDEQLALAARGIESLSAAIGDKRYLMGDMPCGADATLFAFTMSMQCPHFESPLRRECERHDNLVAYVARMRQEYFSTPEKRHETPGQIRSASAA
jgi:glutathione S-transferase